MNNRPVAVSRRSFMRLGGGLTVAAVVAACSRGDSASPASVGSDDPTVNPDAIRLGSGSLVSRVDLGFVSAWWWVKDGRAVLIDTGIAGSTDAITEVLEDTLGLSWSDVSDVIITHHHGDHRGSVPEIAALGTDATFSIGRGDLEVAQAAVSDAVELHGLDDTKALGGLNIISTPGHTPGHISVQISDTRALFMGDAAVLNDDGTVSPPPEQFTDDSDQALASLRTLAQLEPTALYFGHGGQLDDGGADALQAML